jgi:hypothetical protein
MSELSPDQLEHIKNKIDKSSERYKFAHALVTDRDRKLAVVTVYESDGELHTAVVKTDDAPMWLSNTAQFEEVVDAVVKKLQRGF